MKAEQRTRSELVREALRADLNKCAPVVTSLMRSIHALGL